MGELCWVERGGLLRCPKWQPAGMGVRPPAAAPACLPPSRPVSCPRAASLAPPALQVGLTANSSILGAGGFNSYLWGNPDIHLFNISVADQPRWIASADPPLVRPRGGPGSGRQ